MFLFIAVKNSFVKAWGCRGLKKSVIYAVNDIWVRCLQHEQWETFWNRIYDNGELE